MIVLMLKGVAQMVTFRLVEVAPVGKVVRQWDQKVEQVIREQQSHSGKHDGVPS